MDEIINNCYRILGLQSGASLKEVQEAYAKLKKQQGANKDGWEGLKEINWAHENVIRYLARQENKNPPEELRAASGKNKTRYKNLNDSFSLRDVFFHVDENVNSLFLGGRVLIFLVIVVWGMKFIFHPVDSDYTGQSFLHVVNLVFHEAGHPIFSIFGDFMGVLGGSLMQLLVPAVCLIAFLKRKDTFGSSAALWWLGQSFIDIAPYINDARKQDLILLGGVTGQDVPGFHDWNNILGRLNLLKLDHFLAYSSHYFGAFLMIVSFCWGGYILYLQYKNLGK
jgi:hypothetical protein